MSKFKNNTYVMAERLKELRKSKKLSHAALSESLRNEYDIKISKDVLIAYEAPQHHAREGANNGMSARYLRCLADFYGVSADYLLGFDVPPTPNMDERAASEYTHLSVEAIRKMREWANCGRYVNKEGDYMFTENSPLTILELLNKFLERTSTYHAFERLCVAIVHDDYHIANRCSHLEESNIDKAYESLPIGYEIINGEAATEYRYSVAEEKFKVFVRRIKGEYRKNKRDNNGIDET